MIAQGNKFEVDAGALGFAVTLFSLMAEEREDLGVGFRVAAPFSRLLQRHAMASFLRCA